MEANTLHCQACGASVGEHDLSCPYCGSELATLACPQCLNMVSSRAEHCPHCGAALTAAAGAPTALACPDCRTPLVARTVAGMELDQCGKCGGIWTEQKTFEKIAADRQERGAVMGSLPAQVKVAATLATVHYRPCPRCAKLMNRQNYAHISGVVINICKEHGIWFERDELTQVLAFIEDGGLERDRAHQMAQMEAERHQAAAPSPVQGGDWSGMGQAPPFASTSLASVVESLVAHFFR